MAIVEMQISRKIFYGTAQVLQTAHNAFADQQPIFHITEMTLIKSAILEI